MNHADIVREIYRALERANALRPPDDQIACAEESALYGVAGALDSLGLVALILDVEEAISERVGRLVVLADEKAMAQSRSPFRNVRSFADYVLHRLEEVAP